MSPLTRRLPRIGLALVTFGVALGLSAPGLQAGSVVAWGRGDRGQTNVPPDLTNAVAVAAGGLQSLALRSDGTVVGWGLCGIDGSQTLVPTWIPDGLSNVIAIAGGAWHNLALRVDGTVVAWGYNEQGQTNVPPGLSNVVAISGAWCSLALQSSGTVLGWGSSIGPGSPLVTVPGTLSNVVAIAAGGGHNLALRSDGGLTAWGESFSGETRVPPGLTGVTAIAAGGDHSLVLRSNGTVVAWGSDSYGQTAVPAGLSNVVALAAGDIHSLALRADGSVVAWGYTDRTNVPTVLTNAVAVACGMMHSLAIAGPPVPLTLTLVSPDPTCPYSRQTGLLAQRIRVYNTTAVPFPASRIVVQGLPPGTTVFNASGTNSLGQPYIQFNEPLPPGASVDLTLEYHSPTRSIPHPTLTAEVVDPAPPLAPAATPQDILRSLRLDDGSYLIDFATLAHRTYYVQYSPDLATWKTAFPPVTGSGSTLQWVDNGPPKTESHPASQTNRFYRVLLVP